MVRPRHHGGRFPSYDTRLSLGVRMPCAWGERLPSYLMPVSSGSPHSLNEPIRKKVGGSLSRLPPLRRVEMLRRNALMLQGGDWKAPKEDGTLVRKVVGPAHEE